MRSSVALLVLLGLMSAAFTCLGEAANDVTCAEAIKTLMPCLPFLRGNMPAPLATCCIAVSFLNDKASSTPIRRSMCQCLKDTAPKLGVIPARAKQIPDLCKVQLPVPVDPNVDCSKVQ